MSKTSCPLLQNVYCTSFIKKNLDPDLFTSIKCFFSWYLLDILHANYFVPNNQSKKSCPFLHSVFCTFFMKEKSDPTSKKQLQIKKRVKKTIQYHLIDLHWIKKNGSKSDIKNTVPNLKKKTNKQQCGIIEFTTSNYFLKICTPIGSFSMFLSFNLFHCFKIAIKCTK